MSDIKLSIIVPFYNSESYLQRCLESLSVSIDGQKNVEVILVDDGSEDSSARICKDYSKFSLITHTENLGVSCARNTGIISASGEWITFLDSDDTFLPEGIHELIDAAETYYNYNMIQFNHYRYYEEIDKKVCKYTNIEGEYICKDDDSIQQLKMWGMVWNKIYKREFLRAHRVHFPESLQFGEDSVFNLQCIKYDNRVYHVDKSAVLRYFDNKSSLARSATIEDMIEFSSSLFEMLLNSRNSENKDFRNLVRYVIQTQWSSEKCKKIIEEDV